MTGEFLLSTGAEREATGKELYSLAQRLYPICRSKTGNGVRRTMAIVDEYARLELHEVPSGTPAFDWTVPKEWNVTDAWVRDPGGEKVIDFRESNLHLVGYSIPVHRTMPLAQLREHLVSLPRPQDRVAVQRHR